jgi:hypothetical protein
LHATIPLVLASQCARIALSHLVVGALISHSPLQLPLQLAPVIISI